MSEISIEKQELYSRYLDNDMKRLKKISNNIVHKLGYPYTDMFIEDFYEIALIELWKLIEKYDESKCDHFEPYLILCLGSKFKSLRYKTYGSNRTADVYGRKRIPLSACISMEFPITDDGFLVEDVITDKANVFNEATKSEDSDAIRLFKKSLSKLENKIADLLNQGFTQLEVQEKLHISKTSYNNHKDNMERYKYILKGAKK